MAAGWMSHHLFISISDPCGGEKDSSTKTLQILTQKNISNGSVFADFQL